MEKNQPNAEVSTILLNEIYQDYTKNKRRQRYYSYFYYFVLFVFIGYAMVSISAFNNTLNQIKAEEAAPAQKYVAAVKISGDIVTDACDYRRVNEQLERAFKDENAVAILLEIDSPGGSAYDGLEIYNKIMSLKTAYPDKKVIAYVRLIAASAAYMIACAADEIHAANAFSLVGSIGVFLSGINIHNFLKEHKIDTVFIHAGDNKAGLGIWNPISEETRQSAQKQVDYIHEYFKNSVKASRGDKLKPSETTFQGNTFLSEEALGQGLIDSYGLSPEQIITEKVGDYPISYVRPPKKNIEAFLEEFVNKYSTTAARSFYRSLMQEHQNSQSHIIEAQAHVI